ncbi:DUF2381 family protein [Myxococcaceae bacterium GXIMD 01537]
MRALLHPLCGLLLVLSAAPAPGREMEERLTIRTLEMSDHPSSETPSIYVSAQVVTALRFEKEVDAAKTRLLAWEGRFEAPLVGGKKVVLEPLRELDEGEALPLLVTLVDGTDFTFLVKARRRGDTGWIDYQVNVFRNPESYNAVLSLLYDSLNREHALRDENERFKQEENSIDHAYATLLANGDGKRTPFARKLTYRSKNQDMDMVVELFASASKAAALVTLKNTYYGGPWRLDRVHLTQGTNHFKSLPFALRLERGTIIPGQTGRLAVIADRSAFFTDEGKLTDLVLQVFRDDGVLQAAITLKHTLIRE